LRAVFHAGDEGGVGGGDGIDAASGGEDFGSELNGLGKVAGDFGEGGDEEVAEVVAFERFALAEAVVEEAGEQVFFSTEGDHAVAEVAGGEHVEVLAETAGGAAIVSDGDQGGEVGDGGRCGVRTCESYMFAETVKKRREAGASTEGNDAEAFRFGRAGVMIR
jgi:hypothetical protein